MTQTTMMMWSLTQSQTSWSVKSSGPLKHHYKDSGGDGIISNPKRWLCKSAALIMPTNLENSAVATGLETISFHSNSREGQCQRMFKLPHIIPLISHASKELFKILQVRLQRYMNRDVQQYVNTFRCSTSI